MSRSAGAMSKRRRLGSCSGVALSVYACAVAGVAHAQQAQNHNVATVDEIVVTAMKRDTRLLDTPASISAIGSETLRDQQITTISDLSHKIPGLVYTEQNGISQISIRGVSLTPQTGGLETPVALHLDGVYLPSAIPLNFLMMDPGRVEALRGPQGTLYGHNATGGAINFIPAAPSAQWGGHLDASYGNYDTYGLEAALTGPIVGDKLTFRLAGSADGRDRGFVTNLQTGNRLGEYNEQGVRGALHFAPVDMLTIDASVFTFNRRANSTELGFPLSDPGPFMVARNPNYGTFDLSFDQRNINRNVEGFAKQQDSGAIVVSTLRPTDDMRVVSRTAYLKLGGSQSGIDCDQSQIETCVGNQVDESKSFQQEITLDGVALDKRLTYVVGAYYGREVQDWSRDYVFSNSAQGYVDIGVGPLPNGTLSVNSRHQITNSYAAYADLTFHVTDALSLNAGGRWARDSRDADFHVLFSIPGFGNFGSCNNFSTDASASANWDATTWKGGAQYKFGPNSQVYVQFQQGFKSGGFNPASCGAEFQPEKVNGYEVGYKAELLNRTVSLNAAIFHYDYSNMQVFVILPGASPSITNAASSVIDGLELSTTARPSRWVSLDLAGSWMPRAKYNAPFFNTYPLDPTQTPIDLEGNRLPSAPRVTVTAGGNVSIPVRDADELNLRAELYYNSGMYFTAFNTPLTQQKAYALGNAFLTYKPGGKNWDVRLWVRNIFDKRYLVSAYDNNISYNVSAAQSPPRSFGVGVHFEY